MNGRFLWLPKALARGLCLLSLLLLAVLFFSISHRHKPLSAWLLRVRTQVEKEEPHGHLPTTKFQAQGPNITIDVFMRTYLGDAHFATFALHSLELFGGHLFRTIHIAAPRQQLEAFYYLERNHSAIGVPTIALHPIVEVIPPYWQQMYDKLLADTWSSADYIFHMDSDCILTRRLSLSDLFNHGKAIIPFQKWVPEAEKQWRGRVEVMLKLSASYMFMVRLGIMYPRMAYVAVRAHVAEVHNSTFDQYVWRHPRQISEFEGLGLLLWEKFHDLVHWQDLDVTPQEQRFPIRQSWSHGGIGPSWIVYCNCVFRTHGLSKRCEAFVKVGNRLFQRNQAG